MKKFLKNCVFIIAVFMILTSVACSNSPDNSDEDDDVVVPGDPILEALGEYKILEESELEKYGITYSSVPPKMDGAIYVKFGT